MLHDVPWFILWVPAWVLMIAGMVYFTERRDRRIAARTKQRKGSGAMSSHRGSESANGQAAA
jgi:hypothetical protein